MRSIRPNSVLLLLILIAQAIGLAPPAHAEVTGEASVNPRLVRIGVPFEIILEIHADEEISISSPSFPEPDGVRLSRNRINDHTEMSVQGGQTQLLYTAIAEYQPVEPGTYEIGPFRIRYTTATGHNRELQFEPVTVEIYGDAPRPASTIIPGHMPWWWRYFVIALLVAMLAGLIAAWIALRRRQPRKAAPVPFLPFGKSPEQVALEEIKALPVPDAGDEPAVKIYYDQIDDILRRYITIRYDVQTQDLTTYEIRLEFHSKQRFDSRVKGLFVLLNDCDWVKFAKTRPDNAQITGFMDRIADVLMGVKASEIEGNQVSSNLKDLNES